MNIDLLPSRKATRKIKSHQLDGPLGTAANLLSIGMGIEAVWGWIKPPTI
jgi:hypothetical protein